MAIQIWDNYERSSVRLNASSVTGTGNNALIKLMPRLQASEVASYEERWLEPGAKVTGVLNLFPKFQFLSYIHASYGTGCYHGFTWNGDNGGNRHCMYSYDGINWSYFQHTVVHSTYIEFWNDFGFSSDTVYISRSRQMSVHACGDWIQSLANTYPTKVFPTQSALNFSPSSLLSGYNAQNYIADMFSSQQNELNVTIPETPFYAFQINDTSVMPLDGIKKVCVLTAGVHAGEDLGNYILKSLIDYILGNTADAIKLRRYFKILVYPMINAPGRAGGGWRGSFTMGANGEDDANRHFTESGGGLQIITKPKAAFEVDRNGASIYWMFDFHGTYDPNWEAFWNNASSSDNAFINQLQANSGYTIFHGGSQFISVPSLVLYFQNRGASPAIILENGDVIMVTDQQIINYGAAIGKTISDIKTVGLLPGVDTTNVDKSLVCQYTVTAGGVVPVSKSLSCQYIVDGTPVVVPPTTPTTLFKGILVGNLEIENSGNGNNGYLLSGGGTWSNT